MTWITESKPETPLCSTDISPMFNDNIFYKKPPGLKMPICLKDEVIYTHRELYDGAIHPVIVQCTDDCSIHFILN